jgi:phosphotriesterase-related protein
MKKTYHLSLLFFLAGLLSCSQEPEQLIMTVNGPMPASQMGITLTHEHVLVDFIGADSTGYHRWDRKEVLSKVQPFLSEIQEYQVSTLVECTPAYIGRDPWLLKELSAQTGLHLLTNTGYYGAHNNLFIPAEFDQMTAEDLSLIWISEFENGIEESGVKPGFIKIGVDGNDTLSKQHRKIIRAAALTHLKTGLVIASHTGPDAPAFEQLKVLEDHGIDPSCFIWVHAQRGSLEGNLKAASLGTWISLDNLNLNIKAGSKYDVQWYATRIQELKNAGYLNRILISHDAGWYKPGEPNGGSFRGFTGIFSDLIPALEQQGFTKEEIHVLLEVNPRNAFYIRNQ